MFILEQMLQLCSVKPSQSYLSLSTLQGRFAVLVGCLYSAYETEVLNL